MPLPFGPEGSQFKKCSCWMDRRMVHTFLKYSDFLPVLRETMDVLGRNVQILSAFVKGLS